MEENLKQEIRYLFNGRTPLEINEIIQNCFEGVCFEIGQTIIEKKSFPFLLKYNLSMSEVLDYYKIKHDKRFALCPFHKDTNPSLSFNDEKGIWNCFGCEAKGNVISFIKKMETLHEKKDL